jgi:uncharacterized SAM-binding protein YcdF (DUF218 family)
MARTLVALIVIGLVIGIGGDKLYVRPDADQLRPGEHVDAILALGGRIESATYALHLAEQGVTPVVVLSNPYPPTVNLPVHEACAAKPTRYRIICFAPDPSTTRGEARELGALAKANGWNRVAVVAPTFHLTRARMLVRRCYPGTELMLATPVDLAWTNWTYQYVRQSLGFVKAGLMRSC